MGDHTGTSVIASALRNRLQHSQEPEDGATIVVARGGQAR